MLLNTLLSFACVCLFGLCALAAPASPSLEARGTVTTGHGLVRFTRPLRCEKDQIYCLSVLASHGSYGEWFGQGGRISWTSDDPVGPWRTYGEAATGFTLST